MSAVNSTRPVKPEKPYPEFPLFAHSNGSWAKKIRGELHYFGGWSDPESALGNYNRQKDDLHAGRKPRAVSKEGVEVRELCNAFWNAKNALVQTGELSPRTMQDYARVTDLVAQEFGKSRRVDDLGPDDFSDLRNNMAKRWGPHMLGKTIQCIRCLFKFGYEAGMIPAHMRFGPGFKRPSKKVFRLDRAKKGAKLFTANEVRQLIDAAGPQLKAMLLLGINCGYGNSDCGTLTQSALDLKTGWVDFPRPKTGIPRRCRLWKETLKAITAALKARPEPKAEADADFVFVTKYGARWVKVDMDGTGAMVGVDDSVSKETSKLLRKLDINGRKGLGFYTLRHVFRTVADEAHDQPAVDHIMGHESPHMSSVYREKISDERLIAVGDYVRKWLFKKPGRQGSAKAGRRGSA